MTLLQKEIKQNKQWLIYALVATFIWGMAAHGYMFMQSNFSHDSLAEFNGEIFGDALKIITGRFMSTVNRMIFRTSLTIPWLIGILSMLWIGLSVFFTLRIFDIESKLPVFLIAGIYTANLTVSCTVATFMHDLDADMLSLLFSVIAVFFWRKGKRHCMLGAICVMLSLGFYQSYVTVTVVLIMFACILDVLNEVDLKTVFADGMKAIVMLLCGGGLYYLVLKLIPYVTGLEIAKGAGNSMDVPIGMSWNDFVELTKSAYGKYFKRMATVLSPYGPEVTNAITFILFLGVIMILGIGLWNKKTPIVEKILCVALIILLPFAMNLLHVLTYGGNHELTRFSYWLSYLFVLLLSLWLIKWIKGKTEKKGVYRVLKWTVSLNFFLIFVLIYSNVQVANVFYLKKDLENKAYLSLMTRITYRIEECDGYEPGITPVVIVGLPEQNNTVIPGFENYTGPNGVQTSDVLTFATRSRFESYFHNYLNTPIRLADESDWDQYEKDPMIQKMPSYPAEGCTAMRDGILVVKLGDNMY